MEIALRPDLPTYSGGLGVLAGDMLRSAADLGVPIVGVTLVYRKGYFRQRLDQDGWQHEEYINVDRQQLPMQPATTRDGIRLAEEAIDSGAAAAALDRLVTLSNAVAS